ncbi:hypothetical protein EJ03DRAFT_328916 [Teratosphaeria nubilosa]|uniref:CBM1 domain-containing protein n=1 Tax=Teratosphaeria nubilosa TaxID=161662 RepID=A0A6G1L5L3_9PEZI|nr:hypothetical protein EJ03DRAFT_328916 [Teratosphaeria nubilosa]
MKLTALPLALLTPIVHSYTCKFPTNTTADARGGACVPSPGDPNLTWICADWTPCQVEGTPCDPNAWEDKLAGRRLASCGDDVRKVD